MTSITEDIRARDLARGVRFHVRWEGEREVFTDLTTNHEYVRAGAADPVDLEHTTKSGLTVRLTLKANSLAVKRADKKARKAARELKKRGYA